MRRACCGVACRDPLDQLAVNLLEVGVVLGTALGLVVEADGEIDTLRTLVLDRVFFDGEQKGVPGRGGGRREQRVGVGDEAEADEAKSGNSHGEAKRGGNTRGRAGGDDGTEPQGGPQPSATVR